MIWLIELGSVWVVSHLWLRGNGLAARGRPHMSMRTPSGQDGRCTSAMGGEKAA